MTLEEFQEKYCALCGTQRCLGVYDEEFREGCQHYREVFLYVARMDADQKGQGMTFEELLDRTLAELKSEYEQVKAMHDSMCIDRQKTET